METEQLKETALKGMPPIFSGEICFSSLAGALRQRQEHQALSCRWSGPGVWMLIWQGLFSPRFSAMGYTGGLIAD